MHCTFENKETKKENDIKEERISTYLQRNGPTSATSIAVTAPFPCVAYFSLVVTSAWRSETNDTGFNFRTCHCGYNQSRMDDGTQKWHFPINMIAVLLILCQPVVLKHC